MLYWVLFYVWVVCCLGCYIIVLAVRRHVVLTVMVQCWVLCCVGCYDVLLVILCWVLYCVDCFVVICWCYAVVLDNLLPTPCCHQHWVLAETLTISLLHWLLICHADIPLSSPGVVTDSDITLAMLEVSLAWLHHQRCSMLADTLTTSLLY